VGSGVVVDSHVHVIVPEITREAVPAEGWRPHVYREDGRQLVELGGEILRAVAGELVDVAAIIESRRAVGIDVSILSPYVPLLFYEVDPDEGLRRCRIQNEALSALVHAHPGQIAGLAAVPLQDAQLAAVELRALMAAGELAGVEIATSIDGVPLGDDRFEPFWEAAAETGALVFVHPTAAGFQAPGAGDYGLAPLVGNTVETTVAAAHMTLAGVMERHPGLQVLLAHAGGSVLALRGRLTRGHAANPQAGARLRESPMASLRRFLYDTVVYDPEVLRTVVDFVGADRVLLGSDHPFTMEDPDPAATVRAMGLGADKEAAILGENAVRLGLGANRPTGR
jgi:aminocarboxymuconate-semialdehyde decarboxylase